MNGPFHLTVDEYEAYSGMSESLNIRDKDGEVVLRLENCQVDPNFIVEAMNEKFTKL